MHVTPGSVRHSQRKYIRRCGDGGLKVLVIDTDIKLRQFNQEFAWNDIAYELKRGWLS